MKRLARTAVLLALVAGVAACGDDGDDDAQPGDAASGAPSSGEDVQEAASIDIGLSTSFNEGGATYMILAAQELGYFEDENLDVEIVPGSGSGALVEQIVAGNMPVGTPSLGAVVEGLGAGLDLVNFYSLTYAFNFGVYVVEDSPIQDVAELEGLTVGITEPGGGEVAVLSAALTGAGLEAATDVGQLAIGTGDATTLKAIMDGTVDAYASSTVELNTLQVNGGLQLRNILPASFRDLPSRGLITTTRLFEERPDVLARLGRAVAKASLYCQHDPDTCVDFMKQAGPELWEENDEGVSVGQLVFDEAWRGTTVDDGATYGEHRTELYEQFKQIAAGEDDEDWPVGRFLRDDLLEQINDFDRDAIISQATSSAGGS